jgi:hypothetical protein
VPAGGTGPNPVMYFAGMFARGDGTWVTAIGRQERLYRHHPTLARRSSKLKPRRERAASVDRAEQGFSVLNAAGKKLPHQ